MPPKPKSSVPATKVKPVKSPLSRINSSDDDPRNKEAHKAAEKLARTLRLVPVFDLTTRNYFLNAATTNPLLIDKAKTYNEKEGIDQKTKASGRTHKILAHHTTDDKLFLPTSSKPAEAETPAAAEEPAVTDLWMIKKNGRNASDRHNSGKPTKSSTMLLAKNHQESFREICAMRLFQLIWGKPGAVPEAKIVLSDFNKNKVGNVLHQKSESTKVYVASKQVPGLPFNVAQLSQINYEILTGKGKGKEFMPDDAVRQQAIDKLCEQIVIQCILSNPDSIKFDNFYVRSDGEVVHMDFGDAGQDEYCSPDPLAILDSIRNYSDISSSHSLRGMFEGNMTYDFAMRFFGKHIQPQHLLSVIGKLKELPEDELWQVAYSYIYGNESEKSDYANSMIARIRSFKALEGVLIAENDAALARKAAATVPEAGEAEGSVSPNNSDFSSKKLRDILARNPDYIAAKQSHPALVELNKIFALADEKKAELIEGNSAANLEEEEDDIVFAGAEEGEKDVDEDATSNSGESLEQDSQSSTTSSSEDVSEESDQESEEKGDFSGEEEDLDPPTEFEISCSKFKDLCKEMAQEINSAIALPEDKKAKDKAPSQEIFGELIAQIKAFYHAIENPNLSENKLTEAELDKFLSDEKTRITDLLLLALTHYDSYKAFAEVKACGYSYDAKRAEKIEEKLAKAGVNCEEQENARLKLTLQRIGISGEHGASRA